jgi:hypothetical protein
MPDLSLDGEFCEVPFWLDDLAEGERKRASVVRSGDKWALSAAGDEFVFEPGPKDAWQSAEQLAGWLSRTKLRLSPRALTLTSFLRLAVVDQFVHGIGGAIYDQVADRILRQWYGIQPPTFSVGTITLFFPPAVGRERICLRCLADESRRLRHGALGERKRKLVGQIESAPRASAQRTMLFSQMHRELDEAVSRDPRIKEHDERFAQARQAHALDVMLFDRELPYTLQTRQRLSAAISQVSDAFR